MCASVLLYCYLPARVGPGTEFQVTPLIIEGEPGDVDLAGALEDPRGHEQTLALVRHNHIRLIGAVKLFISTKTSRGEEIVMSSKL